LPGREPSWWYEKEPRWQARLLSPVGAVVGAIAEKRLRRSTPYRSRLPVICVGNFTVGGSGKTPLAICLADIISGLGGKPWFLSRGYGGTLKGPLRVDAKSHSASDVGDEPLLLARYAPAVISRDRAEGARSIETSAGTAGVIIMDDGLQNPSLAKDLSIVVVDAARGFGNGRVIPAGPLRAPLAVQIGLADVIALTGAEQAKATPFIERLRGMTRAPIIRTETQARLAGMRLQGQKVIAYAGIANPDRFFSMLVDLGADVVERHAFADHHAFSSNDARDLLDAANRTAATLITTEKDFVRLSGTAPEIRELKARSAVLAIETAIDRDDLSVLTKMIERAINR
jgi:tetraacyldisaccharide 4'-kinase